ncbi:MAG TPA: ABC transporter permease [Anaerolineales bacterium]|nr:ABC transporter permease [Anaerolineales bacterium]
MLNLIRRRKSLQLSGLLAPGALWLLLFFNLPLAIVLYISFVERGRAGGIKTPAVFTPDNYVQFFDPLYLGIFWNSVRIALVVTFACILLGYPLAYYISKRDARRRDALLLLVIIPFWTNFLVRTYALKSALATDGLVNSLLVSSNLIQQPLDMLFNEFAVILGLWYGYIPFAVLPMYASIEKFDYSLMEAAADLGANTRRAFLRVMLPMTMPGVVAAFVLVFVPVVGAFITPDLLGGGKVELIGTLINRQFGVARNWPFGSAISFILMLLVLIGVTAYFRSGGESRRAL